MKTSSIAIGTDVPSWRRDEYVSSEACQKCHAEEFESWSKSYHRTMTQLATHENVLGDFDGSTVVSDRLEYRVFESEGKFWAEMPDPEELMYVVQGGKPTALADLPRVQRQVVMTTGSHHNQTYWVTGTKKYGNLLQTLPLIYLREGGRWIPREQAFMRPPDSGHMVTQWNHHCIRCHSTGGNPGLYGDRQDSGFETEVAELGIACEACHGPGKEHVDYYESELASYQPKSGKEAAAYIVNPNQLDHRRSSQICGQCHSVFIMRNEYGMQYAREGIIYRPGDDLHRTRYQIQHPRGAEQEKSAAAFADFERNRDFFRERWWDDGTVLAGGREYTAITASACYQKGEMSCLSCHTMHHGDPNHQLKPEMETNLACTSCHTADKFNAKLEKHTHHPANSHGSQCQNCHMPHNTYALFSAIRSHQIVAPSAAASIEHGTPNACNLCHLDKTLDWTQHQLAEWYGTEILPVSEDQAKVSAAVLWIIKGNAAQRAIAAWHFGWDAAQQASGNEWLAAHLSVLLLDPYGVVRYVAYQSLRTLPGFADFEFDFLASQQELARAAKEVATHWTARGKPQSHHAPETLIEKAGKLSTDEVRRLLKERDNRPVTIKE